MMLLSEIPPLGGPDPGWAGERLEGYVKTSLAKNRSYFGDGSLHWAEGLIDLKIERDLKNISEHTVLTSFGFWFKQNIKRLN